jgi:hypothetical protein
LRVSLSSCTTSAIPIIRGFPASNRRGLCGWGRGNRLMGAESTNALPLGRGGV